MIFSRIWASALTITIASAFKDTSPFFLFSTSELLASPPDLISANHLTNIVAPQLEICPSDTYIIVSQPGATAADYQSPSSAPQLRKKLSGNDKDIRSSFTVKDVLGSIDIDGLGGTVQDKCGAGHLRIDASTGSYNIAEDVRPRVINIDFTSLPAGEMRSQKLVENDAFLASVLDLLASQRYTVLYTTSPANATPNPSHAEPEPYEMDTGFQNPLHTDLKRDLTHHKRASDANITLIDGPLFERYQYLSPGLFMGLLVSFILISILYVGINGVASLQVSYAAFDKEMGPAAQKKQA